MTPEEAQAAARREADLPVVPVEAVPATAAPVLEIDPLPSAKARLVHLEPPQLKPISEPPQPRRLGVVPLVPLPPKDDQEPPPPKSPWRHLLPLGAILLVLLATVIHDLLLPSRAGSDDDDQAGPALIDPTPLLTLAFHDGPETRDFPIAGRTMSFGLSISDAKNPDKGKRLMYDRIGRTNNTCIRIDGSDYLFGQSEVVFPAGGDGRPQRRPGVGEWIEMRAPLGKDSTGRTREGARSVWQVNGFKGRQCSVRVTQTVEIVPGAQSGRLDTCLIRYTIHNTDSIAHEVGLRFLLDTFIGKNDGVPFTIPGKPGLCSTRQLFDRANLVPDYIQALEHESLLEPGTVAHLQFKVPGTMESPSRVFLGGYPDAPLRDLGYSQANGWYTPWEVPLVAIRELVDRRKELKKPPPREPEPDSAVTLYWEVKTLAPGQRREVGFAYGLGSVASGEGEGKLLLTVGGRMVRDGEFTLTALRASPVPKEKLTLHLPAGDRFTLLSPAEQEVPAVVAGSSRPISTVTWRLRARRIGRSTLTVRSTAGVSQKQSIRIIPPAQGVLD
jgi:hypothetical protein